MVQVLNLILLTAQELRGLREAIKRSFGSGASGEDREVFAKLFKVRGGRGGGGMEGERGGREERERRRGKRKRKRKRKAERVQPRNPVGVSPSSGRL